MFLLFSNQGMRLTHHLAMWLLIAFSIHHIYSAWLMDIKKGGRHVEHLRRLQAGKWKE